MLYIIRVCIYYILCVKYRVVLLNYIYYNDSTTLNIILYCTIAEGRDML